MLWDWCITLQLWQNFKSAKQLRIMWLIEKLLKFARLKWLALENLKMYISVYSVGRAERLLRYFRANRLVNRVIASRSSFCNILISFILYIIRTTCLLSDNRCQITGQHAHKMLEKRPFNQVQLMSKDNETTLAHRLQRPNDWSVVSFSPRKRDKLSWYEAQKTF